MWLGVSDSSVGTLEKGFLMQRRAFVKTSLVAAGAIFSRTIPRVEGAAAQKPVHSEKPGRPGGLKVSDNRRYLADAHSGRPFFLLADTAWNINALNDADLDLYLASRKNNGFTAIMFCLDFYPQSDGLDAYGESAYIGPRKTELNPKYFSYCDHLVDRAAHYGLYTMIYSMWAGRRSGIMNTYTVEELHGIGLKLGTHFKNKTNVIHVAGGESTPPYISPTHVDALGRGLKAGCLGRHLITVHPCYSRSCSEYYSHETWLDFYMIQGQSSKNGYLYDMTRPIAHDYQLPSYRPTMIAENYYDSGTHQPPQLQRRGLYLSVFAGAFGCAYGHDALWQMTPHTRKRWMLQSWPPGVANWRQALNTPAVADLHYIKPLLYSRPYFQRIPDQSLILAGQGRGIANRVQATRDGLANQRNATYLMAYLAAPAAVVLDTGVIAGKSLNAFWFNPASGRSTVIKMNFPNTGKLHLAKRPHGHDWAAVVDDAARPYAPPGQAPRRA